MQIGKEGETYVVEPIEDPIGTPLPEPEHVPEPVEQPEPVTVPAEPEKVPA